MGHSGGSRRAVSRRHFLQSTTVAASVAWIPVTRLTLDTAHLAPSGAAPTPTPPNFPPGIDVYRRAYENWSTEIHVDDVWTCTPRAAADVVTLANWAHAHEWRLRPSGAKHSWAPFNVMHEQPSDLRVLLVDTTVNLNAIAVDTTDGLDVVTVGPGAFMDDVMQALQSAGRGWSSIPAPGAITMGGALAVNGHGAAVSGFGEDTDGFSFGSLSNRIVSLDAVVWDRARRRYVSRTFRRSQPITKALLTTMGRMFVTRFTLVTEPAVNLRCVSHMDVPGDELFAEPGSTGRSFASYLDAAGRVEVIWFPHTDSPWLKVWSVAPTKPAKSREVTGPYNYLFSDNIPREINDLATFVVTGHPEATPLFGQMAMNVSTVGLATSQSGDIWGPARYTQHYVKPTTLRAADTGWAVLTARHNLQRALYELVIKVDRLNRAYRARGLDPLNMPLQLRCAGVDDVSALGIDGAEPPVLSGSTPDVEHPEWDTVVWVNLLSLPGTAAAFDYMEEFEAWLVANYSGDYATARPEWCKGWAFTPARDFTNDEMIDEVIPDSFRRGRPHNANWDWAMRVFATLDPHRVFGNPFTDRLMQ